MNPRVAQSAKEKVSHQSGLSNDASKMESPEHLLRYTENRHRTFKTTVPKLILKQQKHPELLKETSSFLFIYVTK